MLKKLMLISALIVISAFGLSESASAHFELEDTNTGMKALFHVTPDHEPVAGKESVLSFDFSETDIQTNKYTYVLTVKSTKAEAVVVPVAVQGDVLTARYTFPSQGFYDTTLTATQVNGGEVSKLQYGLKVSHGTIAQEKTAFSPIETAALVGVGLVALSAVIVSIRHRSSK